MIRALYLAEIDICLVDEISAVICEYQSDNRQFFENMAEDSYTVAFVDIGACKSSFYVVKFRKDGSNELLLNMHDKNLGGRDLDWQLM